MVVTSHQLRTSLALGAAGGVLLAALLLSQRTGHRVVATSEASDDGLIVKARLASSKILVGAPSQDLAVTITAPRGELATRPPLSLAVVIDRSGSMSGTPLANAKASAIELVDQLGEADAFTIVTYSSNSETIVPITKATGAGKAAAREAIQQIHDEGGTCISCGLTRADGELHRSPVTDGIQRMVLISDGQANEGIWDRDELVALAGKMTEEGTSISAVGVGLDFDEVTMTRIANIGRGHYYFVEDTANLGAMFAKELGELGQTVATDVRLVIEDVPGVTPGQPFGYPSRREGNALVIPVADLRSGETRKVVIPVRVAASGTGAMQVAKVKVLWRRTEDHAQRKTLASAAVDVVDSPDAVAGSYDRDAVRMIEEAHTAHALELATQTFETQGYEAAKRVLQGQIQSIATNPALDPSTRTTLSEGAGAAMQDFAKAPAPKATKATRAKAYELAR